MPKKTTEDPVRPIDDSVHWVTPPDPWWGPRWQAWADMPLDRKVPLAGLIQHQAQREAEEYRGWGKLDVRLAAYEWTTKLLFAKTAAERDAIYVEWKKIMPLARLHVRGYVAGWGGWPGFSDAVREVCEQALALLRDAHGLDSVREAEERAAARKGRPRGAQSQESPPEEHEDEEREDSGVVSRPVRRARRVAVG